MNYTLLGITAALFVLACTFFILTFKDLKRLRALRNYFSEEEQPENLEEIINGVTHKLKKLEQYREVATTKTDQIQAQLNTAHQKTTLHKYNAFPDQGGNLSFTLVVLNKNNDGYIITNMVGRDQARIYCKPIISGKSEQQLTTEEQKTLAQAVQQ